MPCGLALAEGLNESMMDRIGGVAGRFDTSSQTFCFPMHRQNVGVLAGMGKKCGISLSFACSTYITGVMGDVQGSQVSFFGYEQMARQKAKQLFGYSIMYEIMEGALYTRSGPWDE
ncbi:hypothetical protein TRIATDRAFT_303076 [Trichoderma atroviride IMI 206040]|uniref:Uncharacterized protein n=1 Tax=Hypocrea atroviridis (strain ATCC 20476 / IMI 206040) TaxID=452589 RepID=G9PBP4_HYPAI|nr:uncharacterized protein TRIATDRAFT_303076 [Trichoderma atroviride IMI 206040]EHK39788.1 hypothetical protein TRIATDRAFT_303076 [Trichoderma atroviride IMI 206040]